MWRQAAGKNPGFFSGDLWKPPVGRDVRPPPHCYSRRHLGVKRFRRSQKRKHSHFLTQGTAKGPQHVYQAGQKEHLQGRILEFFFGPEGPTLNDLADPASRRVIASVRRSLIKVVGRSFGFEQNLAWVVRLQCRTEWCCQILDRTHAARAIVSEALKNAVFGYFSASPCILRGQSIKIFCLASNF